MTEIILESKDKGGLRDPDIYESLRKSIEDDKHRLRKVLIIPPDITRINSEAGKLTNMLHKILGRTCKIDIMPALGTHDPMNPEERIRMFGESIPHECFIAHNWRTDVVKIGEVPGFFVKDVSEGLIDEPIYVEINKRLLFGSYDLIISIGQVVPHEVAGMANYRKNIFVGCGGSHMINKTHMLGVVYGMERIMGRDHTPVHKVFDYAGEKFTGDIPILYVLTVTSREEDVTTLHGLFIGRERRIFEAAVALSRKKNINLLDRPVDKVVVYLDEKEFKSTWLGNKAIYRTRMTIADNGELIILAPGVKKFGEDSLNDRIIRRYGYIGRKKVLELCKHNEDLQGNLSVAAHLIHGSSDNRFTVTYAVDKLTKEEIESVNFNYMPLDKAYEKYDPSKLKYGFNTLVGGDRIFYIDNPALGLWIARDRLDSL